MAPMPHVVLLGDSIFDNALYAAPEPDVATHLRALLPDGWQVMVGAVDGTATRDFAPQLAEVPPEATHLVVSLGGNDALLSLDLLTTPVASTGEALALFDERLHLFEASYRREIERVARLGRQTSVCTIYDTSPETPWPVHPRRLLALWNDVIVRVALDLELPVIELRGVCPEAADYVAWIEPSGAGGRKVARALAAGLIPS